VSVALSAVQPFRDGTQSRHWHSVLSVALRGTQPCEPGAAEPGNQNTRRTDLAAAAAADSDLKIAPDRSIGGSGRRAVRAVAEGRAVINASR
jgi:hypothetical protein